MDYSRSLPACQTRRDSRYPSGFSRSCSPNPISLRGERLPAGYRQATSHLSEKAAAGCQSGVLVENDLSIIGTVGIEPGDITLGHIDTTMAAVARERFVPTGVIVREVRAGAVVGTPPAVMEEVTTGMVLHRVVDLCVRIPESRSFRFAGLKDRGRLAQEDLPEAWRRWLIILTRGDVERAHQLPVLIVTQGLLKQGNHQHFT